MRCSSPKSSCAFVPSEAMKHPPRLCTRRARVNFHTLSRVWPKRHNPCGAVSPIKTYKIIHLVLGSNYPSLQWRSTLEIRPTSSPSPTPDGARTCRGIETAETTCLERKSQEEGGDLRMMFHYLHKCAGALVKALFWCGTYIMGFYEYGC